MLPGAELLRGAVDCHVHACPHINRRSVTVFEATRQAAAAGMRGLGLMDNFANSSGLAALAMAELGHLGVEVFGGIILEPPAGGVAPEAVEVALRYGYGPEQGARFVSMPTHHTRHVARAEGRSPTYVEAAFAVPESGPLPAPVLRILDLVAAHDVVLNTGHVSAPEAARLVAEATARGVTRVLVPCNGYAPDDVRTIVRMGAHAEFSFFFHTHATMVGLTHVDAERHRAPLVPLEAAAAAIRAAGPARTILSSDCGVALLPPPVEGFREYLLLLGSSGFTDDELRMMAAENPAGLFRLGQGPDRGTGGPRISAGGSCS
jgi:hypothetical protein